MDKHQKTKGKRARALKCLDAHLKSPTSGGIQRKTREDNQRDQDRHNSAEAENPGRSERESSHRSVSRSVSHRSASSDHERNARRDSSRQSGSRHSRREIRSRSSSSRRARSSQESRRKHSRRRRSSSDEPPLWAKELLSQQKKNADELRRVKSKMAKKSSEGPSTASKVIDHEFRYAGNKKQYDVNQSVIKHLDHALAADDQDEASKQINAGKSLLMERNKHLLLADKYGWDTVECYTAEPLASDSEDEKRIKRALKESKSLRNESKAGNVRPKNKKFFRASEKPTEKPFAGGFKPRRQVVPPFTDQRATCFRCWKPGHFARECRSANTRFVVSNSSANNTNNTPNTSL